MADASAQRLENRFLALTLVAVGLLAFVVLREYAYYIVGGGLLVFAFFPVHRRIRARVHNRTAAAALSFLVVVIVILGPLFALGYYVYQDAGAFANTYDPDRLNETVADFLTPHAVGNATAQKPSAFAVWLGDKLQGFAQQVVAAVVAGLPRLAVGLVITGFVLFYGFEDGEAFYRRLRLAIPLPDNVEDQLFIEIRRVTSVVFVGTILIAVVGGVFGGLTFLVMGVPNAMFWGFLMIILGILPFVGAPLIWLPAAGWLYANGHPGKALGLMLLNGLFIVGYLDHILRPQLIGRVARIHPIVVLIGVLGGVESFGVLGFVIGPLVLALFIAVVRNYTEWHPYWRERRASGAEPFDPAKEPARERGRHGRHDQG